MLNELRAAIVADPTVSSLIGSRFYPNFAPQNPTRPYVTYQPISSVRTPTMLHADNLPATRVQIDAWSDSVDEARAVADAILALFHSYVPDTIAGIQGVFAVDAREDYEADAALHRVSTDYMVHAEV